MPLTPLSFNLGLATAVSCASAVYGDKLGLTQSKAANFALTIIPSTYIAFKLASMWESSQTTIKNDVFSLLLRHVAEINDFIPAGRDIASIINCVAIFDDPTGPSHEFLVSTAKKLGTYDRMCSVLHPCSPIWSARWQRYSNFEPTDYICEESLSGMTLQERIQELVNTNLDPSKPAWKIHVIRNTPESQSAIVLQIGHWIADGMHLSDIFSDAVLTDADGNTLTAPQFKSSGSKRRVPPEISSKGLSLAPSGSPSFRRPPSYPKIHQTIVNKTPISLEKVRTIKREFECTVNDVLMSALAGGIRRYILDEDANFFEGSEVLHQAVLGVGFPSKTKFEGQKDWLTNDVGSLEFILPVHLENFEKRCEWVRSTMLKNFYTVNVGKVLVEWMLRLGLDSVFKAMGEAAGGNKCAIVSNVPAWQCPVFVDGFEVQRVYCFICGDAPIISFLSYNGQVNVTCVVDPGQFPVIENLVRYIGEEIEDAFQSCENR